MCLKACLHGKGDRWYPRFSFFALASAFCFWFISVAPVRGGTHFLCRRKESKQRKRAHAASSCCFPRARNVPIHHAATFWFLFVASALSSASPAPVTSSTACASALPAPICGKLCVGFRTVKHAVLAKKHSVPRLVRHALLHTVCRKGAAKAPRV